MTSRLSCPFSRLSGNLLALTFGLVSVLAIVPVSAGTFTWDGSLTSNDWDAIDLSVPDTNWSPFFPIPPSASDTVTFPASASDHTVYLNGNRAVTSLTITGGSGYLITDDTTQYQLFLVSGDLTASGADTHRFGANADIGLGANGIWTVIGSTTLEIDSNISGSSTINKTGTGTLSLGANNSHDGTFVTAGILEIGQGNRLGASGADLVLANDSQLRASGNMSVGSTRGLILSSGGQVDTNGKNVSWAGLVSGTGGFTKTGNGTLTLTGNNTYNGGTTISGGTLQIGNGGIAGMIVGDIVNNGALTFYRSDSVSWGGNISGSGSLTMEGTGTLNLTGTNTYNDGTTVSAGTLKVSSATATGSGPVQVNSGGAISGSGTVAGALTVASGATVAPGTGGIDTLTAAAGITIDGSYDFEVEGNQGDLLTVGGALDFSGTLDITASNLTRDYYVAATYDTMTGSPASNNLPADFKLHTSLPSGFATANGLATKSVAIVRDLTAPVITLQGNATVTLYATLDTYIEEGATASDNFDDDFSAAIGGDTVVSTIPGTYIVTYDATDSNGNAALQATRTVEVLADPTNIILGTNAGSSVTVGTFNSFFGFDAGRFLTTGSMNTIMGEEAGIGLLDTSLGERIDDGAVLTTAYNASENVFLGYRAGWQATTGTDNVFLGWNAGANAGSSTDNTFIGAEAGFNNTGGGNDNTIVGEEAGFQNTTGDNNTFIGEDAGAVIDTGSDNTAIGAGAMSLGGTTSSNPVAGASYSDTAVGIFAGQDVGHNGTTWNNTFVGAYAGTDNGAGRANTFFGAQAGTNSEHADYCTFVGAGAGFDNNRTNGTAEADRNSYLGIAAGFSNRLGSDNVVIGAFADFRSWSAASDAQLEDAFDDGDWSSFSNLAAGLPTSSDRDWNRVVIAGSYATAGEDDAVSIGYGADATSERAIALGSGASASHADSIVIGYGAGSHSDGIAVIGNGTTASIDPGADGVTALGTTSYRYSEINAESFHALADASTAADIELVADAGTNNDDSWRLQAVDSGAFTIASFATGSYVDAISAENTGTVTIAGDLTSNSDLRLKEKVRGIDNALALLEEVEGKTYHWLPELGRDDRTRYGLVAQEVEAAVPELVTPNLVDGIKSVNYQGFIPILTDAMTELDARNTRQREEIALLREQIALQRELLQKLNERNSAAR